VVVEEASNCNRPVASQWITRSNAADARRIVSAGKTYRHSTISFRPATRMFGSAANASASASVSVAMSPRLEAAPVATSCRSSFKHCQKNCAC
jgi:hypothetical protein